MTNIIDPVKQPIFEFSGNFDGQGYAIDLAIHTDSFYIPDMYIYPYNSPYATVYIPLPTALFATITNDFEIKNLITTGYIYVTNKVRTSAGGIVGIVIRKTRDKLGFYPVYHNKISNCINMTDIILPRSSPIYGGIVAEIMCWAPSTPDPDHYYNYTTIENCLNIGTLSFYDTAIYVSFIGGIIGSDLYNYPYITLNNCVNATSFQKTGGIVSHHPAESCIGGIVGGSHHSGGAHFYSPNETNTTNCINLGVIPPPYETGFDLAHPIVGNIKE